MLRVWVAALAGLAAMPASAANIVWSAPVNATGNAGQIVTAGTAFAAVTSGPDTVVNGVSFVGSTGFDRATGTISFGAAPITVTGAQANDDHWGPVAPASWDAGYAALVRQAAYSQNGGQSANMQILIDGLTLGSTYSVQLFEPFWDHNWATAFAGGSATSALVNLAGDAWPGLGAASLPQFVTGTFVANSASQAIRLTSPGGYVIFDAIQVRTLATFQPHPIDSQLLLDSAVPEPASWATMLAGFGALGMAMRRKRAALSRA